MNRLDVYLMLSLLCGVSGRMVESLALSIGLLTCGVCYAVLGMVCLWNQCKEG